MTINAHVRQALLTHCIGAFNHVGLEVQRITLYGGDTPESDQATALFTLVRGKCEHGRERLSFAIAQCEVTEEDEGGEVEFDVMLHLFGPEEFRGLMDHVSSIVRTTDLPPP